MSKSVIYAVNSNSQTITSGSVINYGSIVRKYGSNCNLVGGNVNVIGSGFYDIDTNFTFTAGASGTLVATMYVNGVAVPGVIASETVAADSVYSITIPGMIRTYCCSPSQITVVLTGVAGTVTNASIKVEKE